MIEMTVRLDDDAAKELEQLRLEFCEKTSNKAILKAIKNYRKLLDDYQKTRADLALAKAQLNEITASLKAQKRASEVMEKYIR
ncbi:hypothetical protein ACFQ1T_10500 [Methylophilus glucosoxydans]|uniref:Ribbon-helix-helix protein CopG domain-containing protein n=1 Tax=Methylophilus glucosoxydans TaxID=752553 RepID=A0ABW3GKK3_9PROT